MTIDEAKNWHDAMTLDQRVQVVLEHDQLKQTLCARTLGVPTGASDWVRRSVIRGEQLRNCESKLRRVLYELSAMVEDVSWQVNVRVCQNCMGTKTINNESCVICKGTGLYHLPT